MLKLRPYQEQAVDFLYGHDRAMTLAPVGAGKTAIALTAMWEMVRDGYVGRWLVLAPLRVARSVWPSEAPKWAPDLRLVAAVGSPSQRAKAFADKTAHVVVTNYDNLQTINLAGFDGIVFDELTRLKNPSGKRFKALMAQLDNVNVRWGLTGSFTSNGLEDVFGQCRVVDQKLLGRSKGAFMQEYFIPVNPEFGEWHARKGALEQVMARIRPATFVLEPGVYADKLPDLHTVVMDCELVDRQPYEQMKKQFVAELGATHIVAMSAAAVVNKLQQMASGFAYDTIKTASAKPGRYEVKQTAYWYDTSKFDTLEDLLSENQRDNTVIVYNFKEELAELLRRYPQAQTLDSDNAIERWNAGEIELLLVHPKSAGHGLNLQHGGCKMVFLSLPWSLELYEQTIGRLHRGGQKRDVWVYLLMAKDTVDQRIKAALIDKKQISDIALEELREG
jgi:SNF2 family DNA or RNA helicase